MLHFGLDISICRPPLLTFEGRPRRMVTSVEQNRLAHNAPENYRMGSNHVLQRHDLGGPVCNSRGPHKQSLANLLVCQTRFALLELNISRICLAQTKSKSRPMNRQQLCCLGARC